MRKFILVFLWASLSCIPLYAQVSIGLSGGYTLSAMQFKDAAGNKSGSVGSSSQLKNWHANLLLNIPLYNRWYLQPVVRYITKGAYLEPATGPQGVYFPAASNVKLHYLELPVHFVYKQPLSIGKLIVGLGPYAGYSLNGSYKLDIKYDGKVVRSNSHSVQFNNKNNAILPDMQLRRWDAGANVMLGMEFNNLLMIGVTYSQGLLNLDRSADYNIKNSYAAVTLGILLNREDY